MVEIEWIGYEVFGEAMDGASSKAHVAVLEWWKSSGLKIKRSTKAIDHASSNGHIVVLEWWKGSGLELKWTDMAMN